MELIRDNLVLCSGPEDSTNLSVVSLTMKSTTMLRVSLLPVILLLGLTIGLVQSSEKFSIVNNGQTSMPFMVKFHEPYTASLIKANLHHESRKDLLAEFLNEHSTHFNGLKITDMTFQGEFQDRQIMHWSTQHYKQLFKGIEVFGGELKVKYNHNGHITSMNGVLLSPEELSSLDTDVLIEETNARELSENSLSILHPDSDFWTIESTGLVIYKQELTGYTQSSPLRLVYRIAAKTDHPTARAYEIFVDAHSGEIVDAFSTIHHALHRQVVGFLWQNGSSEVIWDEVSDPNNSSSVEVDNLLLASKSMYTIFNNLINYNSWDNNGTMMQMNIQASALFCPNAFFSTNQTTFCPGMTGIDVVAHEWGHAYVSTYGGNLVYSSQSGALNEAYADIIGESTQLMLEVPRYYAPRPKRSCNINATETLRWIIGDQTTAAIPKLNTAGFTIGIRDMYNPTCYGHPATTFDSSYVCNMAIDNGGVHSNSGIPNQAYALFVDGGVLNNIIIDGVGLIKAFNIYIRALGSHTKTTNFQQHAALLVQACTEFAQNGTVLMVPLTGEPSTETVTAADCLQLEAVIAVTGLNHTVDCESRVNTDPMILSAPGVGAPLAENATSFQTPIWTVTNFNTTNAPLNVVELNHGIPVNTTLLKFGVTQLITISYESDKPLEPTMYSFQIQYEGKTFGPYSYQTWYKPVVVALSTSEVVSHSRQWIELEVKDTVREFRGCTGQKSSPTISGDCLKCAFEYAMTAAFRLDDKHVGCFTPQYVPSNVSLNVSLWLTPNPGGLNALPLNFVDKISTPPVATPPVANEPHSAPESTVNPEQPFNPWVVGAIALVLGGALATLVTSLVCVKKYAKLQSYDQL